MEPITFKHPHWEALTPNTKLAFHLLSEKGIVRDYYLAGGTGLALYLGHRFSLDLDFFSEYSNSVGPEERAQFRRILEDPTLAIQHDKDSTFVATWKDVGVSFFRLDQYPLVMPVYILEGVKVADLAEIGAMKLSAIIGRGTRKDFIDLYFILQQLPIEELFRVAAQKYRHIRDFAMNATRAMAYFEDAERLPMPLMLESASWIQMKRFIEKQATQIGRQHLDDLWE